MERFTWWLRSPLRRGECVLLVGISFVCVLASLVFLVRYTCIFPCDGRHARSPYQVWLSYREMVATYPSTVLSIVIFAPFFEEFMFRYLLVGALVRRFEEGTATIVQVLAACMAISVLFALIHLTHPSRSLISVLCIQGLLSFFTCLLFLRVSRLSTRRLMQAFIAGFCLHVAWNEIGALFISSLF